MAWTSGWLLLLLIMVCGWTGYVMVWDVLGQYLAQEGARILDALPMLSEPVSRAFTGELPLPSAFFFLNLFAHIGVPLAMAAVFWLHVKRLARPRLLPPAPTMWLAIGALTLAAMAWPVPMAPQANALILPAQVPADLFFAFWIPVVRSIGGRQTALIAMAISVGVLALPRLVARGTPAPIPSTVDEEICVGCNQCALDCPYDAITMVERDSPPVPARRPGRSGTVRELRDLRGVVPTDGCRAAGTIGTGPARARPRFSVGSRPASGRNCRRLLRAQRREFRVGAEGCGRRAVSHRLCREPAHIGDRTPVARRHRWRARAGVSAARLLAPGRGTLARAACVPRTGSGAAGARESRARQDRERRRRGSRSCGRGAPDLCRGREGAGPVGC